MKKKRIWLKKKWGLPAEEEVGFPEEEGCSGRCGRFGAAAATILRRETSIKQQILELMYGEKSQAAGFVERKHL